MRIWDLPANALCDRHLLGEHRELHAIWAILTEGKKGYSHHPETLRWRNRLAALYLRHEELVKEFERRGFKHNSPLNKKLAKGSAIQDQYVDTVEEQKEILRRKNCGCRV